ncbi:MAG: hypothetical protein WC312_07300 [Candidatus Omnitrophota bacterium]|jgi:hypothetical protein
MANHNGDGKITDENPFDMPDVIENQAELEAAGFKGGHIDAEGALKWNPGLITGAGQQQYRSLMLHLISHEHIENDTLLELIQELKVGNYLSTKEADLATAAIIENLDTPKNLQAIMIWVINRGSVDNNAVQNMIKGLTHTTTNFNSSRPFNFGNSKRKNNERSIS